jgi:L-malate glycosyltransferase
VSAARAGRREGSAPTIVEGLYSFQIGGSEKLGALLARKFVERGYRVLGLSFFDVDGPIRAELEAAGVECHGLDVLQRSRWRRATLPYEVRHWLAAQNADVVHLHHGVTAIRAVVPAREAGVRRIVVTEHADLQLRTEPRYRWNVRRTLRHADVVTVINRELVEYCGRELRVPPARLRLVPNAVDDCYASLTRNDRVRTELGLQGSFVYAFVGRLVGAKDLPTLLRAFSIARRRTATDLRLVIAGDGAERESLHELARGLGIDNAVVWLGAQADAGRALELADAFAMSSISEGVPMAMLEAMQAGLPCVATSVGGIAAVLADGHGEVVPPSNPDALAAALLRLAGDPQAARRIGELGRRRVEESYSLRSVVDRYLDAFGLPPRWDSRAA